MVSAVFIVCGIKIAGSLETNIWQTYYVVNQSILMGITENQLHSIRQIYLSLLSERMPVIVHSEAMILCQMTRFYCNELSTRPSSGSFKET